MKIKTFAFILTTCYLVLTTGRVFASDFSVGLMPQIVTIDAKAGEKIETFLEIENFSDSATTFSISIKEFRKSETDDNQVQLLPETPEFLTFSKFIRITLGDEVLKELVLAGKTKKKINISVNIPENIKNKDFTFSVLFTCISIDDTELDISRSRIQAAIGSNFLVRVADSRNSSLIIDEFSTNLFFERGPVPFKLTLKNPNSYFVTTVGTLKIWNMFGQLVGKIDLPNVNILSSDTRAYISNTENYPASKDKAIWWNEKFLLGFYTAETSITLPDSNNVYSRKIHFFTLPYQGVILILILTSLILLIRKRFIHHLNT